MSEIKWSNPNSSLLERVAYVESFEILLIKFCNSPIYFIYLHFTAKDWMKYEKAQSKGHYFHEAIKNEHKWAPLSDIEPTTLADLRSEVKKAAKRLNRNLALL